jgi:hypothetical protein
VVEVDLGVACRSSRPGGDWSGVTFFGKVRVQSDRFRIPGFQGLGLACSDLHFSCFEIIGEGRQEIEVHKRARDVT